MWDINHKWGPAKKAALHRDGHQCVKCSRSEGLEVNHIIPLRGMGYSPSCWHHQANLESLCGECHDVATFVQNMVWS